MPLVTGHPTRVRPGLRRQRRGDAAQSIDRAGARVERNKKTLMGHGYASGRLERAGARAHMNSAYAPAQASRHRT
uniref:Uncharacterized protein n=1 Tax=Ralstonia solanacearum TaxID=305 RepID=A0A0S4VIB2_RALSL|nr:protein of unknown function [Ralstonia solanacearum]CUV25195.1 protein of unknown function [Ralstonia solanacearum]CUV28798.1 protein of unknown function [Ralstonia solanacearum]CUV34235.1 protein of unknown function [Ralstonia solanacearum]CUV38053.1 protein of unknown function [Ralstonia solanacearum]